MSTYKIKVASLNTLDMTVAPGKPVDPSQTTREQMMADLVADGVFTNAQLLRRFGAQPLSKELGVTECVVAMRATGAQVQRGDLSTVEAMLAAQAVALNTMFGTMALNAEANIGHSVEATDRYFRLALKCQAQSARTLETLAAIKSPPMVFARQANINNGGQQQVVNHARAGNSENAQTELLEADDGERVDFRAAGAAGADDPRLATVDAGHRADDRGRQGQGVEERLPRRRA